MQRKPWYTENAFLFLTERLGLAFILLFLSRTLIYFFNVSVFSALGTGHLFYLFVAGLRFDLFTLVIINIAFIVLTIIPYRFKYHKNYQRISDVFYYIPNSVAILANFIDVIYFRFTQKRMTIDIFSYVGENRHEIIGLIPDFIRDFWLPFVLFVMFILILVWIGRKIRLKNTKYGGFTWRNWLLESTGFIVVLILTVIAGRGGLQNKPINIVNAGEYTEPRYFPIILNTPFTIIKTKNEEGIKEKQYFANKRELDSVFTPYHKARPDTSAMKRLNVFIIILESFTAEHSAFLNPKLDGGHYKGYTPFLDSLMRHSLVFRGFANGEKSIDGIPAILSGIPSLMYSAYLLSPYVSNKISSIAGVLKKEGYSTAFFHGGTNGTMGFEAYTMIAGFDHYFGRYEYNNDADFDGKWGIFDEPFLQYTAQKLNEMHKPFMASVFTLSSHHPYTIPEKYKGRFAKGTLDIHETIGYTDYALKRFFNTMEKMDFFDSTLFVLVADHTYAGYYPFYKTAVGRYSIPIVFYNHLANWHTKTDEIAQQTDIMPSILDYLNDTSAFVSFGQSAFDSTATRFAVSYLYGIYQIIEGDYVLKFDGEKDLSLYNYRNDSLLLHDLKNGADSIIANKMDRLIKAVVQQYDYRMINNELTTDE